MRRAALLALAVLTLPAPAAASTAAPKTNLPDVEDEVMCPTCGHAPELAESPQAQDERDFIRREIAQGKTKQQIKDDLVAKFGPRVLALPPASGFDLTAYLVPALALAGGRDRDRRGPASLAPRRPIGRRRAADRRASETERLDADLARYDLYRVRRPAPAGLGR